VPARRGADAAAARADGGGEAALPPADACALLIARSAAAGALAFDPAGFASVKSPAGSRPDAFNAAPLYSGGDLAVVGSALVAALATAMGGGGLAQLGIDVVFGPAYKAIPLAAAVAMALHHDDGISAGVACDRKEAKTYGRRDGGFMGAALAWRRVGPAPPSEHPFIE
jgi:orotate phosphoribosyltransferase